jgi:hypothetical protein
VGGASGNMGCVWEWRSTNKDLLGVDKVHYPFFLVFQFYFFFGEVCITQYFVFCDAFSPKIIFKALFVDFFKFFLNFDQLVSSETIKPDKTSFIDIHKN